MTHVDGRLQQLKAQIALPVIDLAQMIGLRRRRFYDLLDGDEPERDRVARIFAVTDVAAELSSLVSDRKKAASALLAPILDGESFFDLASADSDPASIRLAGDKLLAALSTGVNPGTRPAPSVAPSADDERTSALFTKPVGGTTTTLAARYAELERLKNIVSSTNKV